VCKWRLAELGVIGMAGASELPSFAWRRLARQLTLAAPPMFVPAVLEAAEPLIRVKKATLRP
jgi:hypothetical protein